MLNDLKQSMREQDAKAFILEETSRRPTQEDVRDIFLDSGDTILAGAEDDPVIAKLADSIPEYSGEIISNDELDKLVETVVVIEAFIKKSGPSGEYGILTQIASAGEEPVAQFMQKIIADPIYKLIHGNIDNITDIPKLEKMKAFATKQKTGFIKWATRLKILPGYRITNDLSAEWWEKKEKLIEDRLTKLKSN